MLRRVMWLAVYAIAVLAVMRPVVDPDLWWHLRTGEWIVESKQIPVTDPFSTAGPNTPWVAYSWLFDLLVYGLYRGLGLTAILIFRLVMTLAIVFAFQRLAERRDTHFLVAIGLTAAAAVALIPVLSERSWLFSILFSALTLQTILDIREDGGRRTVWWLPLVYVLWANIHIQFVYGLFLLGLACAAPLLDRALKWSGPEFDARAWRRLLGLTGTCLLATLVNPYGYRVYEAVWEAVTQPGPAAFIDEMKAMEFRYPAEWAALLLAGAAAFALGRRGQLSSFDVIFLLAAGYCGFRARRDVWFLILAALAIIPPAARIPVAAAEPAPRRPVLRWGFFAVLWIEVFAGCVGWARELHEKRLWAEVDRVFPAGAVEAARQQHGGGQGLYNPFNWGGYIMWELKGSRVAIDGRCNLHGDERILRIGKTWTGELDWRNDPDLAAATLVIGEHHSILAALLSGDPHFRQVYQDELAVVFVRERR